VSNASLSRGNLPRFNRNVGKNLLAITTKAKFEVYGEEMIEKEVKQSGNSGRVYLPPEWVGKHVKIIRVG